MPKYPAITLLLLWAAPALAVLPPQAYERQRAKAPILLSIKIERFTQPSKGNETCTVSGPVTAIERDRTGRMRVGQLITVFLPCRDPAARPMPGPTLWFNEKLLVKGKTLRVYLNEKMGVVTGGGGAKVLGR